MEELLINTLAEKEIVEESKNSVRTIADRLAKSKAYYNALAANAVEDYLRAKGLISGEIYNLHDSAKMLADFEIADIQLSNLHIDVRAVFDENEIFIPKKHFTNQILPDIYLVLKLDEDLSGAKLLGFVEPSKINKQNCNDDYYFVNKSFLTPASKLEELIKSTPVKTQYMITDVTAASIEKLIMLYMDHDLDDSKLEKLIDYLKNSAEAREKLVEFENFERLSYLALKEFKDLDVENNDFTRYIKTLVTTDEFAEFGHEDELSYLFNENSATGSGLFVDDDIAENAAEDKSVEPATEEEVYEEADVLGTAQDTLEAVEEPQEEVLEAEPVIEDLPESPESVVEEPEPIAPVDEFEAFEAADEFEPEEVPVIEQESAPEPEAIEPQIEEQALILDSEELSIEAGDVLSIELPQDFDVHPEAVAEEEQVEVSPEPVSTELTGEDLEFQVDGLMEINEEPEHLEINETPEINMDIVEDVVLEQEEPVEETAPELDVEKTLALDEVNLDSETVIGLTEGMMVEEVEPVETVVDAVEENIPELDMEALEGLDLGIDEPDEAPAVTVDEVQTVTDEDVDNAIALSQIEEEEIPADTHEHEAVEEISADAESENGEFSLDELLSIENDLTSGEQTPSGFKFDDADEEDSEPKAIDSPSQEELEMLSADLDDDSDIFSQEDAEDRQPAEEYNFDENQEIPEDGTDFAFAVDQRPAAKNILMPVAALITVIGLIGAGAWYFLFNGKNSNNEITIVDDTKNSVEDINFDAQAPVTPANSGNETVADIQIPAESTPAPKEATPAPQKNAEPQAAKTPEVAAPQPEPLTIQKIKKDFSQPNTYLSVSKIVWDVPEYLTYNEDFSGYLQTLGSTLKLNLSGDLLLISENTLLNRVKVKVSLKDSGKKFSAELIDGCGTKSVDDLVLQSVKNTLNLLKPPVNSLDTADEDLYITIYL